MLFPTLLSRLDSTRLSPAPAPSPRPAALGVANSKGGERGRLRDAKAGGANQTHAARIGGRSYLFSVWPWERRPSVLYATSVSLVEDLNTPSRQIDLKCRKLIVFRPILPSISTLTTVLFQNITIGKEMFLCRGTGQVLSFLKRRALNENKVKLPNTISNKNPGIATQTCE